MNNLPKLVMALFGVSAVLDIAEKIHNWGRDKKNRHGCSCKEIEDRHSHRRYCDRMRDYRYATQEFKETGEDPGETSGSTMMLLTI